MMSIKHNRLVLMTLLLLFSSACASRSQSHYSAAEVGTLMAGEKVWIVSSRMVKISGLTNNARTGWGAAIGATLAGATAYGITEADNPAGVAITIIALVGGALAGQFVDDKRQSELGVEYILDRPDAPKIEVVQVVQHAEERLASGQPALLMRGQQGFYRVVPK